MLFTKIRSIIPGWLLASIAVTILFCSCKDNSAGIVTVTGSNGEPLTIIDSTFKSGTGWGYKVYVGGNLYVNQPFIPGVPGKQYFTTEDDAKQVAELVVQKIVQHHLPPTVTGNELRQLNIIK
jgi:Domain of unknown function (DUF4907)